MKKIKNIALEITASIALATAIHYLTFRTSGCGFEGCIYTAGFPFNHHINSGAGYSNFSVSMFALNVLAVLVAIQVLVVLYRRYKHKSN